MLDSLASADLDSERRDNEAKILNSNIKFLDECLSKGSYSFADIQAYASGIKPFLELNVHWSATLQVEHWMQVQKNGKNH